MSDDHEVERGVFDPEQIISVLDRHQVRYVIVGAVAARLHGSPLLTEDIDVTPERSSDNLERLAEALAELDARLAAPGAPEGLKIPFDARTFNAPVMKFVTRAGVLDVVLETLQAGGYQQLIERAARPTRCSACGSRSPAWKTSLPRNKPRIDPKTAHT